MFLKWTHVASRCVESHLRRRARLVSNILNDLMPAVAQTAPRVVLLVHLAILARSCRRLRVVGCPVGGNLLPYAQVSHILLLHGVVIKTCVNFTQMGRTWRLSMLLN